MRNAKFLRRRFLHAGTAALLTSFFDRLGRAADQPKRLVLFNLGNGTIQEQFWPSRRSETDFTLSRILAPLEAWRERLIVLEGMQFTSGLADKFSGEAHAIGIGHALTGRLMDQTIKIAQNGMGRPTGPSLDQFLGAEVGQGTQVPVLNVGVQSNVNDTFLPSWTKDHREVRDLLSPLQAWNLLFGVRSGNTAIDLRKGVLDLVAQDLQSLRARLPGPERASLDGHVEAIRDIEQGIKKPFVGPPPTALPSCGTSVRPAADAVDFSSNANFPMVAKLHMDVILAALACDLTRVVSFNLGSPKSLTAFDWLGVKPAYHNVSHHLDVGDIESHAKIENWHATQLAYLVERLAASKDGAGRDLLGSTLVVWNNNMARGEHTVKGIPYVLVGGDGAGVRTGRHLQYPGRAHNDLLLALAQFMGARISSFGDAAFSGTAVSLV